MSLNYKVATYNTASNSDYNIINDIVNDKDVNGEEHSRDEKLGQTAFRALADMGMDFFCLQEANTYNAGDVFYMDKSWIKDDPKSSHTQRYDYIHNTRGIALVWNKEQFTIVEDSVVRDQDYLIGDFYDKKNHKIVRLASAHIAGYSLEDIKNDDHPESTLTCQHQKVNSLIQSLQSNGQADFTIIGSDTNSIPSYYSGLHQQFESSGYSYDKKDVEATNYHEKPGSDLKYRQLDFIFKSRFLTAEKLNRPDTGTFKLANIENPSDHVPVIHNMKIGFFSRLYKVLCDFFSWRPSIKIVNERKPYGHDFHDSILSRLMVPKTDKDGVEKRVHHTTNKYDGSVTDTIKISR